ncbi:MAG: NADH:flavin oxidoreductase [Muribaculaceae bacterium]|nr:NADH:flavin oxidoreductase [Muribaculaceae bacterium]
MQNNIKMADNKIFTPESIGSLAAKNRIIRSATNDHLGNRDGSVSDEEIAMYDTLARNEVGIIITGHMSVSPNLDYRADEVQLCIGDDRYIDGLSRIASKIHDYDAIAIAQISHAGPKGLHPIDFNELSTEEMERIRDWFIAAAVRAQRAGFDGVQVHIAHWYLLQAVVNIDLNHRTDKYGGSPENCLRLPLEIVESIRKECGPDFIIMVKMNAHNTLEGVDDQYLLNMYANRLVNAGVDLVELSGSDFTRKDRKAELYYIEEARKIKEAHPEIPMSLVGGIFSRDTIEKALEVTEFASLSRTLLTQPDFLTKLKNEEDLNPEADFKSRCIHCNKCFEIFATKYERCVFGPVLPKLEETFSH